MRQQRLWSLILALTGAVLSLAPVNATEPAPCVVLTERPFSTVTV